MSQLKIIELIKQHPEGISTTEIHTELKLTNCYSALSTMLKYELIRREKYYTGGPPGYNWFFVKYATPKKKFICDLFTIGKRRCGKAFVTDRNRDIHQEIHLRNLANVRWF